MCNTINIEINKQTTVQIPRENLTKVSTVDALNDLFAAKKKQTENTSCKYQTSGKKIDTESVKWQNNNNNKIKM